VPESSITCGFEEALSIIVTVPVFVPSDLGVKLTLIVQPLAEAMVLLQVDLMSNCPAIFIEDIFSSVLPVFLSVTPCSALLVHTDCFLKTRGVVGEKATTPEFSRTIPTLPSWSQTVTSGR
jgi:hypothetical protein